MAETLTFRGGTVDKYEYKVKVDEIKSLISQGAFEDAVDVADSVDWSVVKNVRILCMISDLYKKNRLFEESRTVLLYAYNRQKARPIIKSLCELSIELGDLLGAIEYCKEFVQVAPKDPGRYVLKYKILKSQGVSIEEQIEVLEELKSHEYVEKWAYELAELYHKVGMADKCVEECNELILWFVDGKYVIKAYELKAQHCPLTEQETYKYELLRQAGGELNIQYSLREQEVAEPEKKDLEVKNVDVSPYNTQNLQAVVAEGLQDYLDRKTQAIPTEEVNSLEEARALDEEANAAPPEVDPELMVTQMYNPLVPEEAVGKELEEGPDEEENLRPSFSDSQILGDVASSMAAEMLNKEREYVLRQDTDEIRQISAEDLKEEPKQEIKQAVKEEKAPAPAPAPVQNETKAAKEKPDFSNTGVIETFHKGSNMDELLSQEYDGQISLVVPEEEKIEKQITGQITIDDVMNEWERKKKEAEARRIADVKAKVRQQTNGLLANFDESTKSGLLEQIENAMINAALQEEQEKLRASRPKSIKVSDIESLDKAAEDAVKEALAEETKAHVEIPEESDEVEELEEIEEQDVPEEVSNPQDKAEEPLTEESEEFEEPEEVFDEDDSNEDEDEGEETEDYDEGSEEDDEESKDAEDSEDSREEDSEEYDDEDAEEAEESEGDEPYEETRVHRRELSESEMEQFKAFIHHRSTQRQLVDVLDNVSLAAYTGNILVTSEEENEITTFSKLLVKEIQLADANFTGKVAKVSGENLNRKDIQDTLKCVSNGALIISEAEGLKKKTVETLIKELHSGDKGVVVVMQSRADVIDKIVEKNEGMAETFNLRIDLKAFDNKTLVEYAKSYAYDNEYSIDELGILALHTRIDDMQTADHEVTLSEIEDLVNDAMYYADKKTPAHFFDILFGKRYDDEDMIILREKDFMHY